MAIWRYAFGFATIFGGWNVTVAADDLTQKFVDSGITRRVGGYRPIESKMEEAEEIVKKLPEGIQSPKFGKLKIEDT